MHKIRNVTVLDLFTWPGEQEERGLLPSHCHCSPAVASRELFCVKTNIYSCWGSDNYIQTQHQSLLSALHWRRQESQAAGTDGEPPCPPAPWPTHGEASGELLVWQSIMRGSFQRGEAYCILGGGNVTHRGLAQVPLRLWPLIKLFCPVALLRGCPLPTNQRIKTELSEGLGFQRLHVI